MAKSSPAIKAPGAASACVAGLSKGLGDTTSALFHSCALYAARFLSASSGYFFFVTASVVLTYSRIALPTPSSSPEFTRSTSDFILGRPRLYHVSISISCLF